MILIRPLLRANAAPPAQRARGGVLHFSGRQYRRRTFAARRSAAVPRLPAWRRFLLDRAASLARRGFHRAGAGALLRRSTAGFYRQDDVSPWWEPVKSRWARRQGLDQFSCRLIVGAILISACGSPALIRCLRHARRARRTSCATAPSSSSRCCRWSLTPDEHREAQRLLLGADPRGREAVRRHLHLRRSGADDAACRARRCVRLAARARDRRRRQAAQLAYFWASGLLSALLDNAPTYLVFFELAGGDARS